MVVYSKEQSKGQNQLSILCCLEVSYSDQLPLELSKLRHEYYFLFHSISNFFINKKFRYTTGGSKSDAESIKAKNIMQTELMIRLRDAILRVSRYFQVRKYRNFNIIVLFFVVITLCMQCSIEILIMLQIGCRRIRNTLTNRKIRQPAK